MSRPKSPKRTKIAEMFLGKRDKDYDGLFVGAEENVAGEAIYDAVANNDNNKLQKLCKEWGNVDAAINWRSQDDVYKFTPLLIGCHEGHVDCVKTLVKQKAIDVNLPDAEGSTPIWWAASKGHKDVVEVLLKKKGIDKSKILGLEYGDIEHVATPGKKPASRGGTVNKRKRVRKTKRNNKK